MYPNDEWIVMFLISISINRFILNFELCISVQIPYIHLILCSYASSLFFSKKMSSRMSTSYPFRSTSIPQFLVQASTKICPHRISPQMLFTFFSGSICSLKNFTAIILHHSGRKRIADNVDGCTHTVAAKCTLLLLNLICSLLAYMRIIFPMDLKYSLKI